MVKGLFEFFVVIPFNRSLLQRGNNGSLIQLLPKELRGEAVELFSTMPQARRAAESLAIKLGREWVPVICSSSGYVEIPEKIKFTYNTFSTDKGEELQPEQEEVAPQVEGETEPPPPARAGEWLHAALNPTQVRRR